MPVYKNTTSKHITHVDKYTGSKWAFAPGEEKTLDFYLDEPLEDGIVVIDENPIPNPIVKFVEFSGNTGENYTIELTGDDLDYYGEYDVSIKATAGSFNLAFNDSSVGVKTKIESGDIWTGRVHKKYVKRIILEFLEDTSAGKIEFFKTE